MPPDDTRRRSPRSRRLSPAPQPNVPTEATGSDWSHAEVDEGFATGFGACYRMSRSIRQLPRGNPTTAGTGRSSANGRDRRRSRFGLR